MLINETEINATIAELHDRLMVSPDATIESTKLWSRFAPKDAGVYAVFRDEKIVYVGETGSLRGRMRDLRRTVNHTLRRTIGADLFADHPTYQPATSKKKYSTEIENALTEFMCSSLRVRVLPVLFGRKEFEEFLISKYEPKYNKKAKRIKR